MVNKNVTDRLFRYEIFKLKKLEFETLELLTVANVK